MVKDPLLAVVPHSASAAQRHPDTPALVLDTNVVLDWLVFKHPVCSHWTQQLTDGSVRWLASTAMRDELARVLERGVARAHMPDLPALWATWNRLTQPTESRPLTGVASRIRCTDGDDQKFFDLALSHDVRWLLSRDRAVLKLARRVRPLGLEVLKPEAWLAPFD